MITTIHIPIDQAGEAKRNGWEARAFDLISPHGDMMTVVVTGAQHVCTVFFNDLPMLVVFPHEDYRHHFVEYIMPNDLKQYASFYCEVVGELGVQGKTGHEASKIIHREIDDGTLISIWDEFGSEELKIVGFVGVVANAIHNAFPNDTPEVKGF